MKPLSDEAIRKLIIERYPCFDENDDEHLLELENAVAQEAQRDTLRQVVALLLNIPKRFDHNKTCFDCIERLKQELGEEEND